MVKDPQARDTENLFAFRCFQPFEQGLRVRNPPAEKIHGFAGDVLPAHFFAEAGAAFQQQLDVPDLFLDEVADSLLGINEAHLLQGEINIADRDPRYIVFFCKLIFAGKLFPLGKPVMLNLVCQIFPNC